MKRCMPYTFFKVLKRDFTRSSPNLPIKERMEPLPQKTWPGELSPFPMVNLSQSFSLIIFHPKYIKHSYKGGVFGSLMGTPILNPPQSAILGMHAVINRPVVRGENIVARPMM